MAGALVASAIGALFAATSLATRLTTLGQDRLIAIQLARQGIEVVRQIRDTNFTESACAASSCGDWRQHIIAPAEPLPVAKSIQEGTATLAPFLLTSVALGQGGRVCTDYIVRDLTQGGLTSVSSLEQAKATVANPQIFCRRLFVEAVPTSLSDSDGKSLATVTVGAEDALLIRSQVAWLGNGRNVFRSFPQTNNACDTNRGATEWCTEEVLLLTNWRAR